MRSVLAGVVLSALVTAGAAQEGADEKKEAGDVVKKYLEVEWQKRLPFVLNPEKVEPLMRARYKSVRTSGLKATILDVEPNGKGICFVSAEFTGGMGTHSMTAVVHKTKEGHKIDWPATVGYNAVPLKALLADFPNGGAKVRVLAELSNVYFGAFEKAKESHYCIRLVDGDTFASCNGYIEKADSHGIKLYKLLKDGEKHRVIVEIDLRGPGGRQLDATQNNVRIAWLVSESWYDPKEK